jgi:PilZ domain-containing protein
MVEQKESRVEPRKIVRYSARVLSNNSTSVKARTIDISMSGISLMLDEPIPVSQQYSVVFEAAIGDKFVKINLAGRSMYCTCVGTSGFRVGIHFDQHNEAIAKTIRQLMQ